jgi:hypothetical protein
LGGAAYVQDFYGRWTLVDHFREFAETLATVLGGGGGGACVVGQAVEEATEAHSGGILGLVGCGKVGTDSLFRE